MGLLGAKEAKFAGGAVGAKPLERWREAPVRAATVGRFLKGWDEIHRGRGGGGLVEAEAGSQLAGGSTEDAAAEGEVEGAEAV